MTLGKPLAGLSVLEIASLAPAPFACSMLSDLGADVLRIDRPGGDGADPAPPDPLTRGRRRLALDLKDPAAKEAVLELAYTVHARQARKPRPPNIPSTFASFLAPGP